MKLEHFIATELTLPDVEGLFATVMVEPTSLQNVDQNTLEDRTKTIFSVKNYWETSYKLSNTIKERTTITTYMDREAVLGDLGELFLEALVQYFPNKLSLKPETFELADRGQKGYDGLGLHDTDNQARVWLQMKFHCPFDQLGGDDKSFDSSIIRELDSFISATVVDNQIYSKRHRLLITTANGLHYQLIEIGYENKMRFKTLQDLDNIIGKNNQGFWSEFKLACIAVINEKGKIPLPGQAIILRQDQIDDTKKILANITAGTDTLLVEPPGSGKTIVAIEAIKGTLKENQ